VREIQEECVAPPELPRSAEEIAAAEKVLWDRIWWRHHLRRRSQAAAGRASDWNEAVEAPAGARVGARLAPHDHGPWTDHQWGVLQGMLAALRWVLGADWDFLDL
jgi:hypothetical protein